MGGTISALEWSAWHIEVSSPEQTYWFNHYPKVSHTIYAEDFEATIPVAGGENVVIRVVDGNDRQIDNGKPGRPDRLQIIKGVTDRPPDGQLVRLDVIDVRVALHRRSGGLRGPDGGVGESGVRGPRAPCRRTHHVLGRVVLRRPHRERRHAAGDGAGSSPRASRASSIPTS